MWQCIYYILALVAPLAWSCNTLEQEMETKDHSDKVRQRKDDHHNNHVR